MLGGNKNSLTPSIKLIYSDLKLIVINKKEEEMGYLLYSGKSAKTGEVHHIRVFNENKLCYAFKPVTSPILPKNVDLPRMMEDIIEDLNNLKYCGSAKIEESRIWLTDPSDNYDNCSKIQYFVQDWNQVFWKSQEKEQKKLLDPNFATFTSTMGRDMTYKETIYYLSLIAGMDTEGLESLKERGGPLFQRNIRIDVEELVQKNKKLLQKKHREFKRDHLPKNTCGFGVVNATNRKLYIGLSMGPTHYYENSVPPGKLFYRWPGAVWYTVYAYDESKSNMYEVYTEKKGCYGGGAGTWLRVEEVGVSLKMEWTDVKSAVYNADFTPYSKKCFYT